MTRGSHPGPSSGPRRGPVRGAGGVLGAANPMDPVRRGRVLATSLRTSVAAPPNPAPDDLGVAM